VARVAAGATSTFRSLGARVTTASPSFAELDDIVLGTRGLSMVALHADRLPRWRGDMQKSLVWNIEQGLALTPRDIGRAEKLRSMLWERVRRFMARYELLVLPTVAVRPFPVEQPYPTEMDGKPLENYMQWVSLTYALSVTGLPVISVPAGFTRDGLPVGIQIAGRRRQEAAVLAAAAAFEAAAPWTDRIPPVVTRLPSA
jgi:amidase